MERYRGIVDDWDAFMDELDEKAVPAIRRNPLKSGEDFEERLSKNFDYEKSDWNPLVYRLESGKPGKTMMHWRGEYYVQEESASLSVRALEPRKGEKILDMAAAPGGKTTQIAAAIENQGTVVANDVSGKRLQSLHANIYRTGSASAVVTNYDARNLPEERYDRVLLDAPCTGEGNRLRRGRGVAEKEERGDLSNLQKQLVEKAARMTRNTMVYSTCTFAPEENEAVVKHLLENTDLELEGIETEAEHARGVTEFQGVEYGEEMTKTVRIYPHHLNSGGIYVAKLTK